MTPDKSGGSPTIIADRIRAQTVTFITQVVGQVTGLPRQQLMLLGAAALILAVFIVSATILGLRSSLPPAPHTPVPPTPTPSVAAANIGVIVTQFAIAPEQSINSRDADILVETFSSALEPEIRESLESLHLTLGYLGPAQVGRVTGSSAGEREESARDIARAHGADIVIYGVIKRNPSTKQLEVEPEYYVAPESFSDALEVTGSFRFGSDIVIDEPIGRGFDAQGTLRTRATALVHVVVGLSNYVSGDYESALSSFKAAATDPDRAETAGQEVFHILLGNTYLKLGQQAAQACDRGQVLEQIKLAKQEYNSSRRITPEYSRSYAGLASTYYLEALWRPVENDGCADQIIDLEFLNMARYYTEQALNAPSQPKEIGVRTKVLLTRAQTLFFEWNTYDVYAAEEYDQVFDEFTAVTDQIIENYEDGDYPSVAALVVEAYTFRGSAQQILGNYRDAIAEFDAALNIEGVLSSRRMFLVGWKGDCYYELGQLDKAAEAYDEALRIAEAGKNEAAAAYFKYQRDTIDALGQPESTG